MPSAPGKTESLIVSRPCCPCPAPPYALLSVHPDTIASVIAERQRLISKLEGGLYGSLSSLSLDLGATKASKGSKSSKGGSVGEGKGLSMVEMVGGAAALSVLQYPDPCDGGAGWAGVSCAFVVVVA